MKSIRPLKHALGAILILMGASCAAEVGGGGEDEVSAVPAGQSLTTVNDLTCDFCDATRACCEAVHAGSYCDGFSAQACHRYDGDGSGRQRTYLLNCLTTMRTIISAWQSGGSTPPPECHIPGE